MEHLVRLGFPFTHARHDWNIGMLRSQGYLRVKEAAALLGVAPNTIRAWGANGRIPEYRNPVNNYRLYREEDLEQLLEDVGKSVKPQGKPKPR